MHWPTVQASRRKSSSMICETSSLKTAENWLLKYWSSDPDAFGPAIGLARECFAPEKAGCRSCISSGSDPAADIARYRSTSPVPRERTGASNRRSTTTSLGSYRASRTRHLSRALAPKPLRGFFALLFNPGLLKATEEPSRIRRSARPRLNLLRFVALHFSLFRRIPLDR
jgi:hypothetical protein